MPSRTAKAWKKARGKASSPTTQGLALSPKSEAIDRGGRLRIVKEQTFDCRRPLEAVLDSKQIEMARHARYCRFASGCGAKAIVANRLAGGETASP